MKAKRPINRRAIVISAGLTLLLLTGVAVFALDWQETTAQDSATAPGALVAGAEATLPPIVVTVEPYVVGAGSVADAQPTPGVAQLAPDQQALTDDALVAAYQAQLSEAYRALQEAYAQIETLQAAQAQMPETAAYRHDDDEHEHEAAEHEEHHERAKKDHDDD